MTAAVWHLVAAHMHGGLDSMCHHTCVAHVQLRVRHFLEFLGFSAMSKCELDISSISRVSSHVQLLRFQPCPTASWTFRRFLRVSSYVQPRVGNFRWFLWVSNHVQLRVKHFLDFWGCPPMSNCGLEVSKQKNCRVSSYGDICTADLIACAITCASPMLSQSGQLSDPHQYQVRREPILVQPRHPWGPHWCQFGRQVEPLSASADNVKKLHYHLGGNSQVLVEKLESHSGVKRSDHELKSNARTTASSEAWIYWIQPEE